MVIAIDGPAGSGKSTIAKRIARELGYYFLNTGSFYRAYTLAQIEKGLDPKDAESVLETAGKAVISVKDGDIYLDGVNVENRLHTPLVDSFVSPVSSDPKLRELVTRRVRELAGKMNIVTEGRDTTTVIFPDAEYKFYFDATAEERARRRLREQEGMTYEEVLSSILERDRNDMTKKTGALKIAKNAVYIDTTNLTMDDVCEKVYTAMQEHSAW